MARPTEHELIATLARLFRGPASRRVAEIGIGDDAAVLRAPLRGLVWTVDAAVEGVHFDRKLLPMDAIGARAFHAAVSDIAAMGARPIAALSALAAPRALAGAKLAQLAAGQARAAHELRCPVVGGNVARASELSVTTTVIGIAKRPLTRGGARPGDDVWLVGDVGMAHVGLVALQKKSGRSRVAPSVPAAVAACVRAFVEPRALVREGQRLVGRASAACDVSDGLAGDAAHIAEASRVRLILEETLLAAALRPELVVAGDALGVDPLTAALSGGEDYALVACGPPSKRPRFARRIGRVTRGRGLFVESPAGALRATGSGFDHYVGGPWAPAAR